MLALEKCGRSFGKGEAPTHNTAEEGKAWRSQERAMHDWRPVTLPLFLCDDDVSYCRAARKFTSSNVESRRTSQPTGEPTLPYCSGGFA
jgi:hypothetical protein